MSDANRNSAQTQNVRHIPIYVEGRDKPLLNTISHSSSSKDSNEFFDDSVKSMGRTFSATQSAGTGSNQFPTNTTHTTASTNSSNISSSNNSKSNIPHDYDTVDGISLSNVDYPDPNVPPAQQNQQEESGLSAAGQGPKNETTIEKIQAIQRDVLDLMERVGHYECHSKRDKEYIYLDEMLTQHLLKLDTIDSDGNEIIKKARREAIKCINKCIESLEAKAEAAKQDIIGPNKSIDKSISSQTAIT